MLVWQTRVKSYVVASFRWFYSSVQFNKYLSNIIKKNGMFILYQGYPARINFVLVSKQTLIWKLLYEIIIVRITYISQMWAR